jgi:hypothetical protein
LNVHRKYARLSLVSIFGLITVRSESRRQIEKKLPMTILAVDIFKSFYRIELVFSNAQTLSLLLPGISLSRPFKPDHQGAICTPDRQDSMAFCPERALEV